MKHFIVLTAQISLICSLLSGCEKNITTSVDEESTPEAAPAFELIYQVNDISLSVLESHSPKLIIAANGTASTAGWASPQLTPFQYVQPPPDGIYDYSFVALPPDGLVSEALTPITIKLTLESIPSDMKGVRIHAKQNQKVTMLPRIHVCYSEFKDSDPNDRFIIKKTDN